jgi:hypothetical protein
VRSERVVPDGANVVAGEVEGGHDGIGDGFAGLGGGVMAGGASGRKSWTLTASASWLQTRPAFLNWPINPCFLMSTLICGSPAALNPCRCSVMYSNCRSRSGCAALDSSCLVFACSRYP